ADRTKPRTVRVDDRCATAARPVGGYFTGDFEACCAEILGRCTGRFHGAARTGPPSNPGRDSDLGPDIAGTPHGNRPDNSRTLFGPLPGHRTDMVWPRLSHFTATGRTA